MSVAASFLQGCTVRIPGTVRDINGVLTDPGGIELVLNPQSSAPVIYTYGSGDGVIVRDGVGLYHADIVLNVAGVMRYAWEASAPNQGIGEAALNVIKRSVKRA